MQRVWHRKHDGWWYATVRVGGRQKQFKLHRGSNSPQDRAKAEDQLTLTRADELLSQQSGDSAPAWLTVGDLVKGFLAFSAREHDSATAEWYGYLLGGFTAAYGKLRIGELRKKHVLGFATRKYDNPTSQNKAVVVIKRVFAWATEEELIPRNPVSHVRKPNKSRSRDRILEPHERALIEKSICDQPFRDYFMALCLTGCRPGEIAKVMAEHVNLDQGLWILPEHKTARKTGRPRIVYLSPEMIELSRRLLSVAPAGGGPIFRNHRGKPWTRNAVRCRFRRLREKHPQLKGVVAYSLRHTFATDALERGIPDADVAALMGHTGTGVLHAWYSKLSQRREHLKRMAARATGDVAQHGTPAKSA